MELTPGMLSGIVGGTAVVSLGAFRVIEALVKWKSNGKGTNGEIASANATVRTMCDQLRDLHNWHNVKDGEGRPLWFFPHAEMKELTIAIKGQTVAIKELTHEFKNGKCPRQPD